MLYNAYISQAVLQNVSCRFEQRFRFGIHSYKETNDFPYEWTATSNLFFVDERTLNWTRILNFQNSV